VSQRTIKELTDIALRFRDERHWKQFHNAKDLAITLSLEANEVLEHTQWKNGQELEAYVNAHRDALADELADVLHVTLLLAEHLQIDLADAFAKKLVKNEKKYPVHKSRGTHRKYDQL
jgi:NTP pyrophosphatase (non-canonical NTP hydrolase)